MPLIELGSTLVWSIMWVISSIVFATKFSEVEEEFPGRDFSKKQYQKKKNEAYIPTIINK